MTGTTWEQLYWKQITDNYSKLKIIINKMNTNAYTDNEEILHQACLQTFETIKKKGFNGDNYLSYIVTVARNIILINEQKKQRVTMVDIDYWSNFLLNEENIDDTVVIPKPLWDETEEEYLNKLILKKADTLWPIVLKWVSDPQNVNIVDAGLFKFRYMANRSLRYISENTGYGQSTIFLKTNRVLKRIQEEFKDFNVDEL